MSEENKGTEKFIPMGALAFFFMVILTMASIWLVVYFLMIRRA